MAFLVTEAAKFQIHVLFSDNPVLLCSADDECTLSEAKVNGVDVLFPL